MKIWGLVIDENGKPKSKLLAQEDVISVFISGTGELPKKGEPEVPTREALLAAAAVAQTEYWDALRALEVAMADDGGHPFLELDNLDLTGQSVETLKKRIEARR